MKMRIFLVTLLKCILCSTCCCFDRLLEVIGLLAGSPWPQHSVVTNTYQDTARKKADYNSTAFLFHTCATLMLFVGLLLDFLTQNYRFRNYMNAIISSIVVRKKAYILFDILLVLLKTCMDSIKIHIRNPQNSLIFFYF